MLCVKCSFNGNDLQHQLLQCTQHYVLRRASQFICTQRNLTEQFFEDSRTIDEDN